ncbi:MAG: hypothetical protein HUJ31_07845 [Pseudomonadales bacterium]|nr:hypothetical protein [Pseudomonadales bacterium]
MKVTRHLLFLFMLLPLTSLAGEAAQQQMAKILMGINHFPNDQQKETLQGLAADSSLSEAERTIAGALAGVQHWPSDEDKAKLVANANDADQPQAVRDLAQIAHDMQHKVSADDRQVLSGIIAAK